MDTESRWVSPETRAEDTVEPGLRPKRLADYHGQERVSAQLSIFLAAARARQEALDHCLIFGPPGLGKTTLAHIIAEEMGATLRQTSGPVIEKAGDLAALLTNLEPRDVLFIDEIHRLSPHVEEILYPAMEDRRIDIIIGEGPAARAIQLDLPPFTIVGATTRAGLLTSPLRDRFGILCRLEYYDEPALTGIVNRSAQLLSASLSSEASRRIAQRSRGTPRVANRLLRRVIDYAQVKECPMPIAPDVTDAALTLLSVDQHGLDDLDRQVLSTLIDLYDGGPAGLEAIAASIGESSDTLADVVEPFLLQQGFLLRTPRGRMAGKKAYEWLGLPLPKESGDDE